MFSQARLARKYTTLRRRVTLQLSLEEQHGRGQQSSCAERGKEALEGKKGLMQAPRTQTCKIPLKGFH